MSTNALYDTGRNAFLTKLIDWVGDSITAMLVDTTQYTVNLATHQYLSDIAAGARGPTVAMAGKSAAAGVADANDLAFASVPNTLYSALVLYLDTGTPATSRLILYTDTITGLPAKTNTGEIDITFDNGANKVFKL